MTRQTFILATIAALALGYGLTRFQSLSSHSDPSASSPGVGEHGGSPSQKGLKGASRRLNGNRVTVEAHERAAVVPTIEWPDLAQVLETASDKPPINLGEPPDAGDGEASQPIVVGVEPIHIGPELDADDPLPYAGNESSGPLIDIGPRLDADDPEAGMHSTASENPIAIGPNLNANDPRTWELLKAPSTPIEIGERVDAGAE